MGLKISAGFFLSFFLRERKKLSKTILQILRDRCVGTTFQDGGQKMPLADFYALFTESDMF
jgi:hypothetical protein